MVMKGYFTFPTAPELDLYHQMEFSVIPRTLGFFFGGGESYPLSAEMQSVYSTASTDRMDRCLGYLMQMYGDFVLIFIKINLVIWISK